MPSLAPPIGQPPERRLAVVDLGSNTFRLVVFRYQPGGHFQLTDEIRETVRLSAGAGSGRLRRGAIARAASVAGLYAAFCRAAGIDEVAAVATSAIRDATNQADVLAAIEDAGLSVRVLSAAEEARYGYLGIVNSTTLADGGFLDLGGGSIQLGQVRGRLLGEARSAPLGAVRMTEAFLPGPTTSRGEIKALRRHLRQELATLGFALDGDKRMVGTGGAVRTLAAMAQRRSAYPLPEVHGYQLARSELEQLVDDLAAIPVAERARVPGLKQDRAEIMLAGAVTVDEVMQRAGVDRLEVCSQGLREGVFLERFLAPVDPPLLADVRRSSVLNVAAIYRYDAPHVAQVARLALEIFDQTAHLGLHEADEREREWLWAACMLHDIGVIVDYHDHHKHSFYLVLNAGLPGYRHRELAMIALLVRAHRKGPPTVEGLSPVLKPGDEARLERLAACLRIAEQLERGRAGGVRELQLERRDGTVALEVGSDGDASLVVWAAGQEAPAFARAFGERLEVARAGG